MINRHWGRVWGGWAQRLGLAWLVAAVLGLSACGFQMRQAQPLKLSRVLVQTNGAPSDVALAVKKQLQAQGIEVLTHWPAPDQMQQNTNSPLWPDAVLVVLKDQQEKLVVGSSAYGQVRELQLRWNFQFRLQTPVGKEMLALTDLVQTRSMSYNESAALAKALEEQDLYRSMQTELVQQTLQRLSAIK